MIVSKRIGRQILVQVHNQVVGDLARNVLTILVRWQIKLRSTEGTSNTKDGQRQLVGALSQVHSPLVNKNTMGEGTHLPEQFDDESMPMLHGDIRQMVFEYCGNRKNTFFNWRLVNRCWLRVCRSLHIHWEANVKLDEFGLQYLCNCFPHNIEVLDLSKSDSLTSQCWPLLQGFLSLRWLVVPRTIDDGDLAFIAHFIVTRLKELTLDGCPGLTPRCFATLRRFSNLEALNLIDCDIFTDGDGLSSMSMLHLEKFYNLKRLVIQPAGRLAMVPSFLTDDRCIANLATCLNTLSLGGFDFSLSESQPASLEKLSLLTSLNELHLLASAAPIDVIGMLRALAPLTNLMHLSLSTPDEEPYVDEEGRALCQSLMHYPYLQTYSPRVLLSSPAMLRHLTTMNGLRMLLSLNISFYLVQPSELNCNFIRCFENLENLVISDSELSAQLFLGVCLLPRIRDLSILFSTIKVSNANQFADSLSFATTLHRLELTQSSLDALTEEALTSALTPLTRLEWLSVMCEQMKISTIHIPHLPRLSALFLSFEQLQRVVIKKSPLLYSLSVGSKYGVKIDGLVRPQEIFLRTTRPTYRSTVLFPTSLTNLQLHGSFHAEQTDLDEICQATSLNTLAIRSGRFGEGGWERIAKMTKLRALMAPVTNPAVDAVRVLELTRLTSLRKLDLILSSPITLPESTMERLRHFLPKSVVSQTIDDSEKEK